MNTALALEIVNAAGRVAGADPITSFTDGTTFSDTANSIYEREVRAMLDDPVWRWSQRYEVLSLVVGESPNRHTYVYQAPADLVTLRSVLVDGREVDFDTYGDKITCNYGSETEVQAFYTFRADESLWPPKFEAALRTRLEAMFLRAFERHNEAGMVGQEAQFLKMQARRNTSTQRGGREFWRSRLATARRNPDR
jgi:hypothetical protein